MHSPSLATERRVRSLALFAALALVATALAQDEAAPTQAPSQAAAPAPVVQLEPARLEDLTGLGCGECHEPIVKEWARTAHAVAWLDEEYQAAIGNRRRPELCHSCHVPQPMLAKGDLSAPIARTDALHLGIDCNACHLGPDGAQLGPHGDATDAHATQRSPLFTTQGSSVLCAKCHSTNIGPVIGIAKDFPSYKAEPGRGCVSCHMAVIDPRENTPDGRIVRSHELQTPRDPAFLRRAFGPRHVVAGGKSKVVIANLAGHRVPGLLGREIQLTAILLDASGETLEEVTHTIDVRRFLPVDGQVELAFEAQGASVHLTGLHVDPRHPEPIPFLDETLAPEAR